MKLNGLTNNLAGNDKSLSNSYLSHIVELLRTEVANLTAKENALEEITNEHIETQKALVDTKDVKAESVNTNKLQVTSINEKIILSNVIDVLTSLRVNGKDVLTEAAFQGPFTYKGVVETLPETAEAGDVYISNDKVNIFNGTTWDDFILPVGTVSLAEYNKDKAEILSDISNVRNDLDLTKNDLANFKADTETAIGTIFTSLTEVNTKLENKVDEAPKNDNAYVRKNGEWIEQTTADNTVKSVAGESTIENAEGGIKIKSPKVEINTPDFKINGSDLPEVDKFALTKTVDSGDNYYYEMKFGRSPYKSVSSIQQGWCTYGDRYQECAKSPSEKYSIFTKNWQYCKFNLSGSTGGNNQSIEITAMDKDGNINNIQSVWTDWIEATSVHLQIASFFTFNQEYVPEGWDDTVWLLCTGLSTTTHSQNKPYLIELKDGEFSRKIDIYNGVGKLKEQGYTPYLTAPDYSHYLSTGCGKGLRSKTINRICWVSMNVAGQGGNYALIIGGDKNSAVTDPFDPSKIIYVPLPANAYYSYDCMAATDSAWYLQENKTGRMMRITPNGQVSEINLTEAVTSCGFNYIEYTDKNGRPACAYYVHNTSTGGGHYVVFLEEEEGSQVNFIERKVTSDVFTPSGDQWYAQQFKFMENSYYIFFTADCGDAVAGDTDYGSASMKNMLWYWDKATHTTHSINNFYEGISFGLHDFIEMHKTRGNAIWFPYIIQDLAAAKRTGELHFISDIDYTSINAETGKDEGEIQVQTATVGTNHSFFTCGSTLENAWGDYYTHPLQTDGEPTWDYSGTRNQLSATNDDGILCVMSADLKAYALCYGDGNIKVYECSKNSSDGIYNCDPDKVPIVPDEPYNSYAWLAQACLFGMTHGWVLSIYPIATVDTWGYNGNQSRSYTYIGVQYRNGEPTILAEPHLSKIQRTGSVSFPQRTKFEKYDYLQTYDDYERRKKVLGEIRANLQYAAGSTGTDSYFKEVRKEKKLINLLYNDKVISSIEQ